MGYLYIFALAAGLSMDAFAVSVCKGLESKRDRLRNALACGIWFGAFQAIMTLIGFLAGSTFLIYIEAVDHWIAFFILLAIGANMIREAIKGSECPAEKGISFKIMAPLAVATSIDALAAGISLAMSGGIDIAITVSMIGATTFVFSVIGALGGSAFGGKFEKNAQIAGGVILILIGVKILIEHLFF